MTFGGVRSVWLAALLLYAAAAAGDAALHLTETSGPGLARLTPEHVVVAFTACLFWPVDLVTRVLLPEA